MQDDEFAGQGGSYRINPQTGKRELVERTVSPLVSEVIEELRRQINQDDVVLITPNSRQAQVLKSAAKPTKGDA